MTSSILDTVILVCSGVGVLISLYFTLVYYRLLKPDAAFIPSFCRLDEATCQYLMQTRNAQILGARNFILGLLYYGGMMLYAAGNYQKIIPLGFVTFISLFTVLLSAYLVYGLIKVLKTHCVLCYTSHALNLIIFLSLISKRVMVSGGEPSW